MKFIANFRLEKKYIIIYFGFIVSLFVFIFIWILCEMQRAKFFDPVSIIPIEYLEQFVYILPGPLYLDVIILYALPIIIFLIFAWLAPYMVIGVKKLHKSSFAFRTKPKYYIVELGKERKMITLVNRALFIGFLSFSLAALLTQMGLGALFRPNFFNDILHKSEAIFFGSFLFTSLALFAFLPLWLVEDAGVLSIRTFGEDRRPPSIKGPHVLFHNLLEGYAGISVVFALYTYITQTFEFLNYDFTQAAILTPLILIALPFIVTGLFAIPLVLYEKNLPDILAKVYKKLDIPFIVIPPFESLKNINLKDKILKEIEEGNRSK